MLVKFTGVLSTGQAYRLIDIVQDFWILKVVKNYGILILWNRRKKSWAFHVLVSRVCIYSNKESQYLKSETDGKKHLSIQKPDVFFSDLPGCNYLNDFR